MSETSRGRGWKPSGVASGLLLVFFGGVCGAMLGALYVRLFVPRTGMGWDQLADSLGGLMLGGVSGLIVGVVSVVFLGVAKRLIVVAVLVAVSVACVAGLRLLREPRSPSGPVAIEKPFAPWFKVAIRVGHAEEVLRGVEPGSEPLPFTEASIFTAVPEFGYTGWGPAFASCKAEPSNGDMRALVPLVAALLEEASAGSCRTQREDDLGVPFNVALDGERGNGTVQGDCLTERPALLALAAAFEELAERICSKADQRAEHESGRGDV